MKCAVHTDVDATGYCRNCGKPLCPECTRDVRGALYCEPCLAAMVTAPPSEPWNVKTAEPNPGVALALGFIPGLGAVYNGEYLKALIQVVIFGGIIAALSGDLSASYDAMLGIGLGCFYFYMPIDAYRVAKARLGGVAPQQDFLSGNHKPTGAIILIVIGGLFLLGNFGLLDHEWVAKTWPAVLIAIGIWLLARRMQSS
jgi:Domain of unknown function (DUF5668)/B-box zinc finger